MKIDSLFSVAGKVALVTGGSRGIGEMTAAGYLANGALAVSVESAHACSTTTPGQVASRNLPRSRQ